MDKPKRKTHTSSEVKKRHIDKTYSRYGLNLRKVEDADIIAAFEAKKAEGIPPTEYVRQLIRNK